MSASEQGATMTDREVMQQALEALETCGEDEWHSEDDFVFGHVFFSLSLASMAL